MRWNDGIEITTDQEGTWILPGYGGDYGLKVTVSKTGRKTRNIRIEAHVEPKPEVVEFDADSGAPHWDDAEMTGTLWQGVDYTLLEPSNVLSAGMIPREHFCVQLKDGTRYLVRADLYRGDVRGEFSFIRWADDNCVALFAGGEVAAILVGEGDPLTRSQGAE